MITDLVGPEWAEVTYFVTIALAVILVLFLLYILVRFIRRPAYARGRRGKQARLAVTDATAIDDRRRLVLVRRDDIEHLILIGGPTDIVVESDIRKNAPARPLNTSSDNARTQANQPSVAAVVEKEPEPRSNDLTNGLPGNDAPPPPKPIKTEAPVTEPVKATPPPQQPPPPQPAVQPPAPQPVQKTEPSPEPKPSAPAVQASASPSPTSLESGTVAPAPKPAAEPAPAAPAASTSVKAIDPMDALLDEISPKRS